MEIKLSDIYRATLPSKSGNEGWIGIHPSGTSYHVVVPVDVQISRGIMACNIPTDGTPFGGYTGWVYFRCEPFDVDDEASEDQERYTMARRNAERLTEFAAGFGIVATLEEDSRKEDQPLRKISSVSSSRKTAKTAEEAVDLEEPHRVITLECSGCSTTWENMARLLGDASVTFDRYRANTGDFRKGLFLFRHTCGGMIEVLVGRFGRSRYAGRSLAGSHACPGFCYYEGVLSECEAVCEGSIFRRLAAKLKVRRRAAS